MAFTNKIKALVPNLFTLGNLGCGAIAIVLLLYSPLNPNRIDLIAGLMILGMGFDFLDGFAARLLKVSSPIGKELDSLADMISFGLLPGMLIFSMMANETGLYFPVPSGSSAGGACPDPWLWICYGAALLIPLFSAYRLAKFNVDERPGGNFYGLATPANAIFWLSLFLIYHYEFLDADAVTSGGAAIPSGTASVSGIDTGMMIFAAHVFHPAGLALLSLLFSILLVSNNRLMAFKFKSYAFRPNAAKYIFLLTSVILLLIFFYKALPLILLLYFIFSFVENRIRKHEILSKN